MRRFGPSAFRFKALLRSSTFHLPPRAPQRCQGRAGHPQCGVSTWGGGSQAAFPYVCCALHPRSHRSWRTRDRQPQQSVLLRGWFQGNVLLGLKHASLFCFPFSAGFSHLPNGLYPSYIPLSHLEPPSAGSPLLAQLGQHSLFESQKGESGSSHTFSLGQPWVLILSFRPAWLWMLGC